MGDDSDYDPTVRPTVTVDRGEYGVMRGVDVETVITFVTLRNLDIKTSTLEVFVAIDLSWNDPRLAWNVNMNTNTNTSTSTNTSDVDNTSCATSINVRANPSIEETEIWVPSLDLRNRASSFSELPSSNAVVSPDGTVNWQRIGPLTAICSFVGLPRMPFDDLGCRMYFADNDVNTVVDYVLVDFGNNETKGFL